MIDLTNVSETKPYITRSVYKLRIIDANTRKSQKGNNMLQLTLEIVQPEIIQTPNGSAKISGLQLSDYIVESDNDFWVKKLKGYNKALGLPLKFDRFEDINPKEYIGKGISAIVSTDTVALVDEVTKEPITDSDGNVVEDYTYRVQRVLGPEPGLNIAQVF